MEAVLSLDAGQASGIPLHVRLRRAERARRLRAFLLVSPLLLYILFIFILPIGLMLVRAVYDPDIAQVAPQTLAALAEWDGTTVPEEPVFAALAADMKIARDNQTLGLLGKRINYELPGTRSVITATSRQIGRKRQGPYKAAFIEVDPLWGQTDIWTVMRRAGHPVTPYYLLASVDRHIDTKGHIVRVAPNDAIFVDVLIRTLGISTMVTLATLVLGYPVAFLLASLPPKSRNLLMIIVLLPFFTSLLVRTTAWVVLLQTNGVINDTLMALGLIQHRLQLIFQRSGTLIAMTHIQLPFTLLPIYSVMGTIRPGLTRAARSLGATPGVGAGCLLTFILSLGYYITPALVGGPSDQMVSSFVASYMNQELNWGMASALGAVLLAITLVIYLIYTKLLGVERMRFG